MSKKEWTDPFPNLPKGGNLAYRGAAPATAKGSREERAPAVVADEKRAKAAQALASVPKDRARKAPKKTTRKAAAKKKPRAKR